MAETTAEVRRDIELTRERMSTTLQQLEQKLNVMQIVRDNPWPSLAVAVGAGVLLSQSRTDVRAAAATVAATKGASSKVGTLLDDVVATFVGGLHDAFESRINTLVGDLKNAIGATPTTAQTTGNGGVAGTRPSPTAPAADMASDRSYSPQPVDSTGGYQPIRAD